MNDELEAYLDVVVLAKVLGVIMDRLGVPPTPEEALEYMLLRNDLRAVYDKSVADEIRSALVEFGESLVTQNVA